MITTAQAIEAIKTIKEYCNQTGLESCGKEDCSIGTWCYASRDMRAIPELWQIPQERTEE